VNIELCTDLLAARFLERIDPGRTGAFIEVGLGGRDFSFTWAAPAGFRSYAVEPLPGEALIKECRQHGVALITAAVGREPGQAKIYVGNLNGRALPDISSLNPRWWGSGSEVRVVPVVSLKALFIEHGITKVSLLKIDTEGSERPIIESLTDLPDVALPQVVAFEYGGGGTRGEKGGGWAEEFFANTIGCLNTLKALGYRGGILIEAAHAAPQRVDFDAVESFDRLFPADARVGNFIAVREPLEEISFAASMAAIQPSLAREARHAARQQRMNWLRHQRIRLLMGIKRRLPWARERE
jgi:FkbM family methyltransferase